MTDPPHPLLVSPRWTVRACGQSVSGTSYYKNVGQIRKKESDANGGDLDRRRGHDAVRSIPKPVRSPGHRPRQAATEALADAGAPTSSVRSVIFANATQGALEGQHGIRGQAALDGAGFGNAPVINVENACASASTALNVAHALVDSGAYECVLAIGAEKMVMPDPAKSMAVFEGSWDSSRVAIRPSPISSRWGAKHEGSARFGNRRAAQRLHGRLRRLLPSPHGEVRHDATSDGGGERQKSPPLGREPALAISQGVQHRTGARRATDRLAAHPADVQPDQRRRCSGVGVLARSLLRRIGRSAHGRSASARAS